MNIHNVQSPPDTELKILSLLPGATEIVCAVGAENRLVGVSHECDYPETVQALPTVTQSNIPSNLNSGDIDAAVRQSAADQQSLYSIDVDTIKSLQPNVILTQSLCDVCAVSKSDLQKVFEVLDKPPRVVDVSAQTLADVLDSVRVVGQVLDMERSAKELVSGLQQRIDRIRDLTQREPRRDVLLLEWLDPPFAAGHWNPELIELAGGRDPFGSPGAASQQLTWSQIQERQPEVIIVACCGFTAERTLAELPALESNPAWRSLNAVQSGKVVVLDGSAYFNRPGPRLVDGLEHLARAIHPPKTS